jgi:carbamoyltransferase
MIILGINETSHDASVSLIKDGQILFAGHAERYSKEKNDWYINDDLLKDAFSYGFPDHIAYYEKPLLKASRLFLKGGSGDWLPRYKVDNIFGRPLPVKSFKHHYSHACAGYYTSQYTDAAIVVLDAIGEYNTSTIWVGEGEKIKLKYKQNYPVSFGLFYSAFTELLELMPNQEEYIMMGMAAYGNPDRYFNQVNDYFPEYNKQRYNFHKGIKDFDWGHVPCFAGTEGTGYVGEWFQQRKFDLAAAVQKVYELRLSEFMHMAYTITGKKNLVFMGGCALNSKANTMLWNIFKDVWIMPNPGDAGSSLGAALALYGKHIEWKGPYLGHDIGGKYPVQKIFDGILKDGIVAVASGRAEYGPRALGNRSILADPRDPNIKDKVNLIKQREMFRPFAPVVLEEFASEWFDMNFASPYMQYTVKCKYPDKVPSVVHVDGTSRVQTVNRDQHPGLHMVLRKFYWETGIPMLLNTSLNIKGQPLLNDKQDAIDWQEHYRYNILTSNNSLVG